LVDIYAGIVQQKFGSYDYQHVIDELLYLQQVDSVEEYATAFEALQYQISMHDLGMSDAFFISQFIKWLKPELRYVVQGQVPATMESAIRLAKIQESIQEKSKPNQRGFATINQSSVGSGRVEKKTQGVSSLMTKER
jgi:hypothetical protein